MIYDTLFGMDAQRNVSPQMVETYQSSPDKKTWTLTLRDGLEFHDGTPVTSADVIASLKRWGQSNDGMAQRLIVKVTDWEIVSAKTFRIKLNSPYGLVVESLGKPEALVPFIMPKRVAETPANQLITDYTGSGPFIFKADEHVSRKKVVYVRNPRYRPRREPPSGTAGGKIAKVDRVEWIVLDDPVMQTNALSTGEVDMIQAPAFEQYPALRRLSGIHIIDQVTFSSDYALIFNHLQPPFNNLKVRQAAMAALDPMEFLRVQVNDPRMYTYCQSVYYCGSSYATSKGMEPLSKPSLDRARQLLKESGYNGETLVLLQPTDLAAIAKMPIVTADRLRKVGFKVDMQPMPWNTLLVRRAKTDGWNIFISSFPSSSSADPISSNPLSGAGYPKGWYGWPTDAPLERLRDAFALAITESERKFLAEQIQVRAIEIALYVPLGEYRIYPAARSNVTGFVPGLFPVYWNLEKR
jgi:peptide/nickel transport system substrate-binding protein